MKGVAEYTARAAESLAAALAATTERDRLFHRRAHSLYNRLSVNEGKAEERATEEAALKARTNRK